MSNTPNANATIALAPDPVRTHGDRSLWLKQALGTDDEARHPHFHGHAETDVCIIGGGFTGLWTAYECKARNPGARVTVLEADICGGGASGRNGGFALTWWAHFQSLVALCGLEEAALLARRADVAIEKIGEFCREHRLDDAFNRAGWVWAATNPSQVGAWTETQQLLAEVGEAPFQELSPREIAAVAGSQIHLAGLYEPGCAAVQPAQITRALVDDLANRGVQIYEHSQVTSIERGAKTQVTLASGSVTAEQVVLAAGAWAARIPEIGAGLMVVSSDIITTEPAPERLAEIGVGRGVCVSDCRRLVQYYRSTPDGRMLFGKGAGAVSRGQRITATFDHPGPRSKLLEAQFLRTYPTLWDVPIAERWSGPIDYSMSALPFFVRLRELPNVIVCAGFSGDGVGPTRLAGELIAEMVCGTSDAGVPEPLRRVPSAPFPMPPEPLRQLGGRAVRRAIQRKESAEDRGFTADPLTLTLARLDPTGSHDRGTRSV